MRGEVLKCYSCKYRWRKHSGCDYIGITGHMRGCPPGDSCTKYERQRRDATPPRRNIVVNVKKTAELRRADKMNENQQEEAREAERIAEALVRHYAGQVVEEAQAE